MTLLPEADVAYLDYRVGWRAGSRRAGKHASRHGGTGGNFRGYRPFWQLPDARHIDVRRSIIDPGGEVVVRLTEQRSSILLMLAADVSRSMAAGSGTTPLASVATLARAAERSSMRAGDAFGFLAFDQDVRADLSCPPTRGRSAAAALVAALSSMTPTGRNADGIVQLAAHLPSRRCLLLLMSDFLMPLALLEAALTALARHDVVPLVLVENRLDAMPRAGLLRIRDAETGGSRLLLMRPGLHRQWSDAEAERRRALDALFERHGRAPFYTGGAIDVAAVSHHLLTR